MAEQKTNGGNRNQQMVSQRGRQDDRRSLARRGMDSRLGRLGGGHPIAMMRRMLDDLDMSPFGVGALGASPFSMMRRMFNDMERLFENVDLSDIEQRGLGLDWSPQIDVTRDANNLVVRADVPGIPQDQIQIYAQDNALVIEGERKDAWEDESGDVWRAERTYGRFRRVVPLPEGTDTNNVTARSDNGVLEITVPLPEASKGRKIEIQGAGQGQGQQRGGQAPIQNAPSQTSQSQKSERH